METNFKKQEIKKCACGKARIPGHHKCILCISKQVKIKQKEQRAKQKAREVIRRAKKKEKRVNSLSKLTREADILFSQAIRLRDKKCRRTGSTENLQCSHIFGRSNKILRWNLDNAFTLSAGQHLYWWHKEPAEAVCWAIKILGNEKWQELEQLKNQPFKLTAEFIKERIEFLKKYIVNNSLN